MINASIFPEICVLSAFWPVRAGGSAGPMVSEVTVPLCKALAREGGPSLSDVPEARVGRGPGQGWGDWLMTFWASVSSIKGAIISEGLLAGGAELAKGQLNC